MGEEGDQAVLAGIKEKGAHVVGHCLHVQGLAVGEQLGFEVGGGGDAALLGEVGVVGGDLAAEQEYGVVEVAALVAGAVEDGVELLGQQQVGRCGLNLGKDVEAVEQVGRWLEGEVLGFGVELDENLLFAVAAQACFEQQLGKTNVAVVGIFEHQFHLDLVAFQLQAAGHDGGQLAEFGGGYAGVIKIEVFRKAVVAVDDAQAGAAEEEKPGGQRAVVDELEQLVLEVLAQDEAAKRLECGRVLGLNLGEAKHGPGGRKAAPGRAG